MSKDHTVRQLEEAKENLRSSITKLLNDFSDEYLSCDSRVEVRSWVIGTSMGRHPDYMVDVDVKL